MSYETECIICASPISAKNHTARTCSDACRKRLHRQRRAVAERDRLARLEAAIEALSAAHPQGDHS